MKKNILFNITLLFITLLLVSWGSTGHKKINLNTSLSFNQQMSQFINWSSQLSSHASDADDRKTTDPTEAPKHYINIDNYQEFVANKHIIQNWDSIVSIFGYSTVSGNGILPWATVTTVDTLRKCFIRKDWAKAILVAADLGHYVGDGHMPLHLTDNYDGQSTGNSGIHSRYESTMIGNYNSQIIYAGDTSLQVIQNINQYVFNYIYNNYIYKDSILAADNFAKSVAGGSTSSSVYSFNLWNKTKDFTIILFKNASHSLAELIYTAWVQAGKPEITPSEVSDLIKKKEEAKINVYPNPFSEYTNIEVTIPNKTDDLHLEIIDQNGKIIDILANGKYDSGKYSFKWQAENLRKGSYFCVLKNQTETKIKKILLLK